jgi:hypothetical protein
MLGVVSLSRGFNPRREAGASRVCPGGKLRHCAGQLEVGLLGMLLT